jgi:hypothetical protein
MSGGGGPPGHEWPRLERLGEGHAAVVRSAARMELRGPVAEAILARHEHLLLAHGGTDARLYLMGILDGLAHAAVERTERLLEESKARRERFEATARS